VQRKGYWNMARVMEAVAGRCPADAPTFGEILESKLRHRVFRPGSQPRRWERLLSVVDECQRLLREDVVQPDSGRPGQGDVSQGQAGESSNSTPRTSDGLRSILGDLLAKFLGGG